MFLHNEVGTKEFRNLVRLTNEEFILVHYAKPLEAASGGHTNATVFLHIY